MERLECGMRLAADLSPLLADEGRAADGLNRRYYDLHLGYIGDEGNGSG
jgi:hypothetical protein